MTLVLYEMHYFSGLTCRFFFLWFFVEVKMYLIILEEMQKYDVALEVISGPLGGKYNQC